MSIQKIVIDTTEFPAEGTDEHKLFLKELRTSIDENQDTLARLMEEERRRIDEVNAPFDPAAAQMKSTKEFGLRREKHLTELLRMGAAIIRKMDVDQTFDQTDFDAIFARNADTVGNNPEVNRRAFDLAVGAMLAALTGKDPSDYLKNALSAVVTWRFADWLIVLTQKVIRAALPPMPADWQDKSGFVLVSILWENRFETYKEFKNWLDQVPKESIRRHKPSINRLYIHAGDWATYWANHDQAAARALSEEGQQESRQAKESRQAAIKGKKRAGGGK